MSAAALPSSSLTAVQESFLAELPRITRILKFNFRRWPRRRRAEAITDAIAATWNAWHGLFRRGLDPVVVGSTAIAASAARYVKNGRRLGTGHAGPAVDVYHGGAQRRHGFTLVSLDQQTGAGLGAGPDCWREWLAEDNSATPADQVAFHLDLAAWLARLPARRRYIAERLAEGWRTGELAAELGVVPGAVSQMRAVLARSWANFQGQSIEVA